MPTIKENHLPNLKAKVVVEAIKGKTASQIAQTYEAHPIQVGFGRSRSGGAARRLQ